MYNRYKCFFLIVHRLISEFTLENQKIMLFYVIDHSFFIIIQTSGQNRRIKIIGSNSVIHNLHFYNQVTVMYLSIDMYYVQRYTYCIRRLCYLSFVSLHFLLIRFYSFSRYYCLISIEQVQKLQMFCEISCYCQC